MKSVKTPNVKSLNAKTIKPKTVEQQQEAYSKISTNQIAKKYTAKEGCDNARTDAKHDFKGFEKMKPYIQQYVSENIPTAAKCEKVFNEHGFVEEYIIQKGKIDAMNKLLEPKQNSGTNISTNIDEGIFNKSITDRYKIVSITRKQHDLSITESLIQKALNSIGVGDDIYFICDVAYANVREDLTYADRNKNQYFYWVQNSQTLYDPAGKTAWHTGAEYGFKDNDSRFLFCWENLNKKAITYYPKWDNNLQEIDCNNMNENDKMLYTNKDLYMITKGDDKNLNNYNNHEAILIVTDPTKPGYFAFADKHYAAKGTGILNKSQMLSYRDKGNSLKRFVKLLNTGAQKVFLDEIIDYSPTTQVLAKKIGDAGQSASTVKQSFELQKFETPSSGYKGNIIDFTSNGYHAFVSFDQIAVATATNYNAPIVIQNAQDGMIIYIRNDLISLDNQLKKAFEPISIKENEIPNINAFYSDKDKFIKNFEEIKTKLDEIAAASNDNEYKLLLAKYFLTVPFFSLVKSIHPDVISKTKDEFLKKYIDNINVEQYARDLIAQLATIAQQSENNDVEKRSKVNNGNDIQRKFSSIKNYYKDISTYKQVINNLSSIFDDIKETLDSMDINEIYKNIPKKIMDNIKCCNPFQNAVTTTSEPRNHNAFIERSTQYFGTVTVIVPIFDSLENNINNGAQQKFSDKINETIAKVKTAASENPCFLKLLDITNEQLIALQNIKKIEIEYVPNEKIEEEIKIQETKIGGLENQIKELEGQINPAEKTNVIVKKEINTIKENMQQEQEKLTKVKSKKNNYQALFKKYNLLIPDNKKKSQNIVNDFINDIRRESFLEENLQSMMKDIDLSKEQASIMKTRSKINAVVNKYTENANDIDVFLKGFLGCMTFLRYYQSNDLKVPTIFKRNSEKQEESQNIVINNFVNIAEKLLFKSDYEDETDGELNNGDKVLFFTADNQRKREGYIVRIRDDNTFDIRNNNKKEINISRGNITKIIDYSAISTYKKNKEDEQGIFNKEYDENAFKKLIDMNVISFNSAELTDEFTGFNANQFNFNKVLLLYLEDRINKMNTDQPKPPTNLPEFGSLFKQLFKKTGIAITSGGGETDSIFFPENISFIVNSFFNKNNVSIDSKIIQFKRNMNFVLNTPTAREIITIIQMQKEQAKLLIQDENFEEKFERAHPDVYRKINFIINKPDARQAQNIPTKITTGMTVANKNEMSKRTSIKTGGNTRRFKKITRNHRIKNNKTVRKNHKTKKIFSWF
jgi:hypothetical protein